VRTLSGERPPALRQIRSSLNRSGKLDARGLPICHYSKLIAVGPRRALEACGDAIVGEDEYVGGPAFPEQATFPFQVTFLPSTASTMGAKSFSPTPTAPTRFRSRASSSSTSTPRWHLWHRITGLLPDSVNHYGYVQGLVLRLHRNYTYRGQRRSYLSAACSAPSGFTAAAFPFARASMTFADERTLPRSCRVSG
jgi:hypothetical protein